MAGNNSVSIGIASCDVVPHLASSPGIIDRQKPEEGISLKGHTPNACGSPPLSVSTIITFLKRFMTKVPTRDGEFKQELG